MQDTIRYLVGDQFEKFANHPQVITLAELEVSLNCPRILAKTKLLLLAGQGICPEKIQAIHQKIQAKGYSKHIQICNLSHHYPREEQDYVHKHKNENIMISQPLIVGKNRYTSFLLLNDKCAEMSDHVTGQHIQGMVLTEAARQMMLSVTESFHIDPKYRGKMYFVLNKVHSDYKQFAFPLELTLHYETTALEYLSNGNVRASAEITFSQNDQAVATVVIDFSTYQQEKLSILENKLAKKG